VELVAEATFTAVVVSTLQLELQRWLGWVPMFPVQLAPVLFS
jgi:hypothetical protein